MWFCQEFYILFNAYFIFKGGKFLIKIDTLLIR